MNNESRIAFKKLLAPLKLLFPNLRSNAMSFTLFTLLFMPDRTALEGNMLCLAILAGSLSSLIGLRLFSRSESVYSKLPL